MRLLALYSRAEHVHVIVIVAKYLMSGLGNVGEKESGVDACSRETLAKARDQLISTC